MALETRWSEMDWKKCSKIRLEEALPPSIDPQLCGTGSYSSKSQLLKRPDWDIYR